MRTKGSKVTKFRGRNWIFYNAFDSAPDGLGESLVDNIPIDTEEYQIWYVLAGATIGMVYYTRFPSAHCSIDAFPTSILLLGRCPKVTIQHSLSPYLSKADFSYT